MMNSADKYFNKQIDELLKDCVRENRCPYYPCHDTAAEPLVCLFCYCPFYPCGDTGTGGRMIEGRDGQVWDCTDCVFVHSATAVKRIMELFYEGLNKSEIFKIVRNEMIGDK
jgi:Zn-finger protein